MTLLIADIALIHIPKTGGTWAREQLKGVGLPYIEVTRLPSRGYSFEAQTFETWHNYPLWLRRFREAKKFSFVREPLAWYRSYWAFTVAEKKMRFASKYSFDTMFTDEFKPIVDEVFYAGINDIRIDRAELISSYVREVGHERCLNDFETFIQRTVELYPGRLSDLYDFYTRDNYYVGRTENIRDGLSVILDTIGVNPDVAVDTDYVNRSPSWAKEKATLSDSTKSALIESERRAYERWGYG